MEFNKDSEHIKIGFEGESLFRLFLKKIKPDLFFQVDLIFKIKGQWYLAEVKHQERFKAPPFDGHGLPVWQVEHRLRFYKETNVIPILVVLDKDEKVFYYQKFTTLMKGKYFDTKTKKRRIFPLTSFKKLIFEK